jgi:murein DD-endopeptidase MepM/ murein hydrolase activator NlpD
VTALLRAAALVVGVAVVWLVAAAQVPSQMRLPLQALVAGAVVTQPFGCTNLELEPFDPSCPNRHFHTGVDLAAPTGTEVLSASAGTAHTGFDSTGAGLFVWVSVGAHVRVLYCHLSAFRVSNGEAVASGQVVGLIGATGRATGPHLHFEVQVDGRAVDPSAWLAVT